MLVQCLIPTIFSHATFAARNGVWGQRQKVHRIVQPVSVARISIFAQCATPALYVTFETFRLIQDISVCGYELQEIILSVHLLDLHSAASCSFHSFTRSAYSVEGLHLALSPSRPFHDCSTDLQHYYCMTAVSCDLGWYCCTCGRSCNLTRWIWKRRLRPTQYISKF